MEARDAAWVGLERADAPGHVALWTDLAAAGTRRAGARGGLCSSGCWRGSPGNGALAWCAVDRAVAREPDHSLALLVGDLLTAAVPPTDWERVWAMPDRA